MLQHNTQLIRFASTQRCVIRFLSAELRRHKNTTQYGFQSKKLFHLFTFAKTFFTTNHFPCLVLLKVVTHD